MTVAELRAELPGLTGRGTRSAAVASDVFVATSGEQPGAVENAARPLITIHGLPAAFLPILLDSPLDIDPAFVEAHAAGRSYRPLGVRRGRGARAARYAQWEYPELVTGYCREYSLPPAESTAGVVDLACKPVVWRVSDTGKEQELAAVFCRASLWVSQDVDVLFVDQPCWGERGPLMKARRAFKFVGNLKLVGQEHGLKDDERKRDGVAVTQWKGEEVPTLESVLQDSLTSTHKENAVFQVLQETAYEQWVELFEVLTPRQRVVRPEKTSLEWRIMQALERNFDMAKSIARRQYGSGNTESFAAGPDDWGDLLQRLRTRVEILAATSPWVAHKKQGKTANGTQIHEERISYVPSRRTAADRPSPQGSEDNQRALDRVTYLGGILLPFSIVSGVLSMNEAFEPGQPLFWVFWVATIPLTLFIVMVIYADKLRQVEVWEVLDPSSSDSDEQGSTGSGDEDKVQETEKGKRKPAPVFGTSGYDRRRQHGAATYSAGGDVVIDLGTPTAEMQQISVEPPEPYGEGPRTDSDQDQEATSSDEDTAEGVVLPAAAQEARHRPAWKKKQLGWGGAAMCMLKIKKPLWVLDGTPVGMGERQRDN